MIISFNEFMFMMKNNRQIGYKTIKEYVFNFDRKIFNFGIFNK